MANVLRHALIKICITILIWIFRVFAVSKEENWSKTIDAGNHSQLRDPAPVLVAKGANLELVTRSFRGKVQWYKDDHSLELMRRFRKHDYDQLNVTTSWNETTRENILHLYNVSKIHSGNYSCERTHHYPDGVSKHFSITVHVHSKEVDGLAIYNRSDMASLPLTPAGKARVHSVTVVSVEQSGAVAYEYFANHTEQIRKVVGDEFRMECGVEGHPDSPAVYWDKDENYFSEWKNNRTRFGNNDILLVIKPVQCSEAGVYTCTVNTSRGILRDRTELKVELGTSSTVNIDKYDCQNDGRPDAKPIELAVGQELRLGCAQVKGHKEFGIGRRWEKRVPNTNRTCDNPEPYHYMHVNATDPEWVVNYDTYVKENVTPEDSGSYRCIAKNLAGSDGNETAMYCVKVRPFSKESPYAAIASAIVLAVLVLVLTGCLVYRRVKPQPIAYYQPTPNQMTLTDTSNNPAYPYPWLEVVPDTPNNRRYREIYLGSDASRDAKQMESLLNDGRSDRPRAPEIDDLVRAEIQIGQFQFIVTIDQNDNAFVPHEGLRLTRRLLGKGAFGEVWEGTLVVDTDTVRVAAKRLSEKCVAEESLHEIVQECRLMQSMAPHENVLRCLGFCISSKNLHLLTEFAANGNLKTYMEGHKDDVAHWNYALPVATDVVTAYDLLHFSWQIAKGMRYLAETNIVHRDLAARNVLVNENKILKIADFGLSRRMTSKNYYRLQKQKKLPMKWMAPESLTQCIFDSKSDVWSFGVVIWEIAAFGQEPYDKLFMEKHIVAKTHQCMASVLRSSIRLPAPSHATSEMYSIMLSCWTYDAERRPAFPELERQLNALCNRDELIHPYILLSGLSGPFRNQTLQEGSTATDASAVAV